MSKRFASEQTTTVHYTVRGKSYDSEITTTTGHCASAEEAFGLLSEIAAYAPGYDYSVERVERTVITQVERTVVPLTPVSAETLTKRLATTTLEGYSVPGER